MTKFGSFLYYNSVAVTIQTISLIVLFSIMLSSSIRRFFCALIYNILTTIDVFVIVSCGYRYISIISISINICRGGIMKYSHADYVPAIKAMSFGNMMNASPTPNPSIIAPKPGSTSFLSKLDNTFSIGLNSYLL